VHITRLHAALRCSVIILYFRRSSLYRALTMPLRPEHRPKQGQKLNIIQKASNFAIAGIKHLKSGRKRVSNEVQAARMGICRSCDYFVPNKDGTNGGCNKCGCNLNIKTSWATSECPLQKWRVENGDTSTST
jgi:hypothetical protein